MSERERISVQVDEQTAQKIRARGRVSDVVRAALDYYLDGNPWLEHTVLCREGRNRLWADMDRAVQRATAIASWSQQDRKNPPSPLPFTGDFASAIAAVEGLTVEQLWDLVDEYL